MPARAMSPEGIALLRRLEGVRREVYLDEGGLPTIGVGHLIVDGEAFDPPITDDQVDELLRADLARFETAVAGAVKVSLTQAQFDALVSFAFNVGVGAFARSTLLRKLNRGDILAVPAELRKWTMVQGKHSRGLAKRREAEIARWSTS